MKGFLWGVATAAILNAGFIATGYVMDNYPPNYITMPIVLTLFFGTIVCGILSIHKCIKESF